MLPFWFIQTFSHSQEYGHCTQRIRQSEEWREAQKCKRNNCVHRDLIILIHKYRQTLHSESQLSKYFLSFWSQNSIQLIRYRILFRSHLRKSQRRWCKHSMFFKANITIFTFLSFRETDYLSIPNIRSRISVSRIKKTGYSREIWPWRNKKKSSASEKETGDRKTATTYSPTCAVPSAWRSLTSLFGMGRGGTFVP